MRDEKWIRLRWRNIIWKVKEIDVSLKGKPTLDFVFFILEWAIVKRMWWLHQLKSNRSHRTQDGNLVGYFFK